MGGGHGWHETVEENKVVEENPPETERNIFSAPEGRKEEVVKVGELEEVREQLRTAQDMLAQTREQLDELTLKHQ